MNLSWAPSGKRESQPLDGASQEAKRHRVVSVLEICSGAAEGLMAVART